MKNRLLATAIAALVAGATLAASTPIIVSSQVRANDPTILAKVKFEVLCSDQAQLPLKLNHIKAVGNYQSLTVGKMRTRTGLKLDLPTEAQWECACRAGTDSNYNNGGKNSEDLRLVGSVGAVTADVGSYALNAWGIYDMHANAAQWCLDAYGSLDVDPIVDPMPVKVLARAHRLGSVCVLRR